MKPVHNIYTGPSKVFVINKYKQLEKQPSLNKWNLLNNMILQFLNTCMFYDLY